MSAGTRCPRHLILRHTAGQKTDSLRDRCSLTARPSLALSTLSQGRRLAALLLERNSFPGPDIAADCPRPLFGQGRGQSTVSELRVRVGQMPLSYS